MKLSLSHILYRTQTSFRWGWHALTVRPPTPPHTELLGTYLTHIYKGKPTPIGAKIEALRNQEAQSRELLKIEDFGAGYGGKAQSFIQKEVREVVRSSARGRKEGELLYRLCEQFQPAVCLELGTNLGFSTLYQVSALQDSRFISIEGATALSQKAAAHLATFDLSAELLTGEFSGVLANLLSDPALKFDYVFIDGNHRYEAVVTYVNLLLPRMNPGGILVVDDIRWSKGMEKAWQAVSQLPDFSLIIDLFAMGICFLGPEASQKTVHLTF